MRKKKTKWVVLLRTPNTNWSLSRTSLSTYPSSGRYRGRSTSRCVRSSSWICSSGGCWTSRGYSATSRSLRSRRGSTTSTSGCLSWLRRGGKRSRGALGITCLMRTPMRRGTCSKTRRWLRWQKDTRRTSSRRSLSRSSGNLTNKWRRLEGSVRRVRKIRIMSCYWKIKLISSKARFLLGSLMTRRKSSRKN